MRKTLGVVLAAVIAFAALPAGFALEKLFEPMPTFVTIVVAVLLFGPAYLFLFLTLGLIWIGHRGAVVAALLGISLHVLGLVGTAFFFYFALHDYYERALYLYLTYAASFLFFEIASLVVYGFMAGDLWRRNSPSSAGPV